MSMLFDLIFFTQMEKILDEIANRPCIFLKLWYNKFIKRAKAEKI